MDIVPKYLLDFPSTGVAQGMPPKESPLTNGTFLPENRIWREDYYVVRLDSTDIDGLDKVAANADVIEITPGGSIKTNASALSAIGVDVSGLNQLSSEVDYERRLFGFLRDNIAMTLAIAFPR